MDARGPVDDAATLSPETDAVFNSDYWFSLIDEKEAGKFLDLSSRHMQGLRYRGDGPLFMRLGTRCIRYTRTHLKKYADKHLGIESI